MLASVSLLAAGPAPYEFPSPWRMDFWAAIPLGVWIFVAAVFVLMIVSMWKIYAKAGKPGWASLIPFYNMWVLAEICGKPGWWGLLCLIPYAGIVFLILLYIDLAKRFGKGAGYAVGLILLGIVFFPMLAFGDARYHPAHTSERD